MPGLLRPSREGALRLHPLERAPVPVYLQAARALRTGLYWLSAKARGCQPLSLLLSGPPGSGPLKDQQALSASFSLLLSYRRLRTTRFRSIKGPTHITKKKKGKKTSNKQPNFIYEGTRGKKEETKTNNCRRKDITNIRIEISEIETSKTK